LFRIATDKSSNYNILKGCLKGGVAVFSCDRTGCDQSQQIDDNPFSPLRERAGVRGHKINKFEIFFT
jgi:hypothetical protein